MIQNISVAPVYNVNQWVTRIWETDQRYYIAEVKQDIFGKWIIVKRWGSYLNQLGNSQTVSTKDRQQAIQLLAAVGKRRIRRHYRVVNGVALSRPNE